jgi:hypothetical protein
MQLYTRSAVLAVVGCACHGSLGFHRELLGQLDNSGARVRVETGEVAGAGGVVTIVAADSLRSS